VVVRKILVAVDGSAGRRALEAAAVMAREYGLAALHALAVAEPGPRFAATVGEVDEVRAAAEAHDREVPEQARRVAGEHGVELEGRVVHGHATQTIVEEARAGGYDLLVMGDSGHSGVWGQFLGTTTDRVGRHAPCSVLIVR
jgi:nucleotide-binding universal stress UspA family protein